ncbi:fic family toxin-antitoxin system, toxin component [Streptomyces pinistramenti]|uniref:fic family toxin-antitoxin system, toxin component n=1 Tax=Streptomyces pinistramenti TaxID=2884812 RepID=UPI001D0984FA|nr:fic family toxin-antitoxin system, toxin component [Streptomyces pinistramenti]MCB5909185.1 fic family toxin-antitoxin system, toxin component [Streptomyces pinistramenti]
MTLRIDLAWLLLIAEQHTPGDPPITDWGALVAAVSRHEAEILGVPVYTDPQDRAAALLQLLLHVPALARSNAMFATAVAYGYLIASGLKIATSPERVRDLARLVKDGTTDLHAIAEELRSWTV